MSRHSPKEIERIKRIAAKMNVEPAGAKAHSLHPMVGASGSSLKTTIDVRARRDKVES
jgi:hypothetical protein